ncbi:hypothetical protein N8J89_18465 [Crossiella sp. CA-258035]|uniref:hypothetical protein n=1 Tax=Crossiella sp. CA-258035 TaxID=2981138 RepID=UPI0024BCC25C|nr:hypothetical protein [Crossiella sp. CA-258035]WHT22976.1 hypothetical protein N8J89_18465 [Crossiella sp. CA-258035]
MKSIIALVVLAIAIAIAMLTGATAASAFTAKGPDQVIVCEYIVDPGGSGAPAWNHSQFIPTHPDAYFWANRRVWATPSITWNRNANTWARHLAGSGGYWTYADKLRRTSAKCLPL